MGIGRLRRALLLALVPALLVPSYAAAATFTPTVTADGDNGACTPELCTLRDAFEAANASPGSVVAIPPGRYLLSLGELSGDESVALTGAGARTTIVDAQGSSRVFNFTAAGQNVAISDLTVTGGVATPASPSPSGDGGGIASLANLALQRVAIVENSATFSGGGLVASFESLPAGPNTAIRDSLIANNRVTGGALNGLGGGAALFGNAAIANTTISGNLVSNPGTNEGGGLVSAKDLSASEPARLALLNTTIADNHVVGLSPGASPDLGGGLAGATLSGTPVLTDLSAQNTLIAGNSVNGVTQDCGLVQANLTSFNLSSDASCGFADAGSKQNTNPQLLPLADNGGQTNTMAITDTSPAKNTGTNTACPPADQREVTRPQALICDIGAYERKGPALAVQLRASRKRVKGARSASAAKAKKGKGLAFIAVVSNRGEQTATGTRLSITLPAKTRKLKPSVPCQRISKKKKKGKRKGKRRKGQSKVLECQLGDLAAGAERTIQVGLRPTKRKGKLVARATVTNTLGDPDPAAGTASATVRIKRRRR